MNHTRDGTTSSSLNRTHKISTGAAAATGGESATTGKMTSMGRRIKTTAVRGAPKEDSNYAREAHGTDGGNEGSTQGTGKEQYSF